MINIERIVASVPLLCWCVLCACLFMITLTSCIVMLRSSTVNVTVSGLTMAMTKAVDVQQDAAKDLEEAARTIAKLEGVIRDLKKADVPSTAPWLPPTSPTPQTPQTSLVSPELTLEANKLHRKAGSVRSAAQQLQQQVESLK